MAHSSQRNAQKMILSDAKLNSENNKEEKFETITFIMIK